MRTDTVKKSDRRFLPCLFDMGRLFAGPRLAMPAAAGQPDETPRWKTDAAVRSRIRALAGFPHGARILIAGEAGSGKTTLALAMARALMTQWSSRFPAPPDEDHISWVFRPLRPWEAPRKGKGAAAKSDEVYEAEEHELCYLNTELDLERLRQLFAQYGWFDPARDSVFVTDGALPTAATTEALASGAPRVVVPTIPDAKVRLPLQGSGEVVNLVLNRVKDAYAARRDERQVFVVVDSLTAILKDSRDPGERRRDALQFLDRLREAVRPCHLALAFLIAERPPVPEPVAYADEVAAHFVFRLGQTTTSPGRFLRTLTVTKSAGVNLAIGEHTWAVLTQEGLDSVIAQCQVAEWVRKAAKREVLVNCVRAIAGDTAGDTAGDASGDASKDATGDSPDQPWATVGVFPKVLLQPIGQMNKPGAGDAARPGGWKKTGTPGLDELLAGDVDYWVSRKRTKYGALKPGSTTLLVGTAGTGKTTLCLQFLAAQGKPDSTLYVNFESKPSDIVEAYKRRRGGDDRRTEFGGLFDSWKTLYRRRGNLDLNLLLAEIRFVMAQQKVERVVLDGLSDLLATTQRDDYARMVEAVLGTIREMRNDALTFVAFEFDPGRPGAHLPQVEGLSATADNVVVLRQILINDEFRKTAYVLKARGLRPDAQVREVRITNDPDTPVSIESGLESYGDLLSDKARPVEVYLQLFAENNAERRHNQWLTEQLRELFVYKIHIFDFSRTAMTRTIEDAISPQGRVPQTDVKVVSLDEWWVREYGVRAQQPAAAKEAKEAGDRGAAPLEHPLLKLDSLFGVRRPDRTKNPTGANGRGAGVRREGGIVGDGEDGAEVQDGGGRKARAEGRASPATEGGPHYRPSPSQFWIFEVEKASVVGHTPRGPDGSVSDLPATHLLAVPNYTDFAMFCVNTAVLDRLAGRRPTRSASAEDREPWTALLRELPRVWVRRAPKKGQGTLGFAPPDAANRTAVVDWMKAAVDLGGGHGGFCFDMETTESTVCMFLELAWAFGASEDFLIADVVRYAGLSEADRREYLLSHPATEAMRLLQYLVHHKLMSALPVLKNASKTLFSRQWYSTLREHVEHPQRTELAGPDGPAGKGQAVGPAGVPGSASNGVGSGATRGASEGTSGALLPLPFFPVGTCPSGGPSGDPTDSQPGTRPKYRVPPPSERDPLTQAYADALTRFSRLTRRVYAALDYRAMEGRQEPEDVAIRREVRQICRTAVEVEDGFVAASGAPRDVAATDIKKLRDLGDRIRAAALGSQSLARGRPRLGATGRDASPSGGKGAMPSDVDQWDRLLPAARWLNVRDVLELLRWHDFRLDVLTAELEGRPLSDLVTPAARAPVTRTAGSSTAGNPPAKSAAKSAAKSVVGSARKAAGHRGGLSRGGGPPAADPLRADVTALTGYCCSGSWMVGVGERTHNPLLSWKLMEEMTSLEASVKRSEFAAGVPVRKDFYDSRGAEPVLHAPHLTWNDLLLYGGSRARRRDRAVCPGIRASNVFHLIHRQVLQCLTVAGATAGMDGAASGRDNVLETTAVRAVKILFDYVLGAMDQMMADAEEPGAVASVEPVGAVKAVETLKPVGDRESPGADRGRGPARPKREPRTPGATLTLGQAAEEGRPPRPTCASCPNRNRCGGLGRSENPASPPASHPSAVRRAATPRAAT